MCWGEAFALQLVGPLLTAGSQGSPGFRGDLFLREDAAQGYMTDAALLCGSTCALHQSSVCVEHQQQWMLGRNRSHWLSQADSSELFEPVVKTASPLA